MCCENNKIIEKQDIPTTQKKKRHIETETFSMKF